ncbi:chemotaxis protein CheB [Paraburkholderia rhynchosiae]|uniref:protein-glutamate methylesterase n=1 Tax=Paraburkholderia rhynchosiae TaxID=487049 RepID=A0A2N7WBQ2_9BURK|nr:chemotaxis protein CheB [Paraburkholderia rhynchosiae]PMS26843.1 chemotaxis protein CheB [Paraburkholderia rhynchosiae]CAB3728511.1 Protein-glutamate methylesterase/protein-glutamine glutaminase [Paraburkholderia rhynchosiae]
MDRTRDIVVVAASTGGLAALRTLLRELPEGLPATILIVMHIGSFPSMLPELLQAVSRLAVSHARDGEPLRRSTVYVAPPDRHMVVYEDRINLSRGPRENFARPAADPLFRSAAVSYGRRVIGVVLTGHLDDGAAGLRAVQACGGYTIVQDPADCAAAGMPKSALEAVAADVVAPVAEIAGAIVNALKITGTSKEILVSVRKQAEIEARIARTGRSSVKDLEGLGQHSSLTCPECGGAVWRIGEGQPLRYRCHTGHAFSAASLHDRQQESTEEALWSAVRRLDEELILAKQQLELAGAADGQKVEELQQRIARLELASTATRNILIDRSGGKEARSAAER